MGATTCLTVKWAIQDSNDSGFLRETYRFQGTAVRNPVQSVRETLRLNLIGSLWHKDMTCSNRGDQLASRRFGDSTRSVPEAS